MTDVQAPPTWLERVRAHLDAHDLHFYGGLLLAAAGGALLSVAWTLVGVGIVLVIVGFVSSGGGR